ncbi:MAG: hypothetical protein R6U19_05595 [Bacteroidales bacterium]
MEDKIGKILNILLYALMGISVILGIYYIFITSVTEETTVLHIYWAYALLIIAALVAIIAPVIYIILNPAKAKTVLIGLIGFVVLAGISYILASGATDAPVYEKFEVTAQGAKRVGAGLIATYILGGLAVVVTIFSGISKVFK